MPRRTREASGGDLDVVSGVAGGSDHTVRIAPCKSSSARVELDSTAEGYTGEY